jgi:hypothetical protein
MEWMTAPRRAAPLAAVALALGASCATAQPASTPVGAEFRLRIGESATVADAGLTVTFVEVVADSRCPAGVVCMWMGEVTIALDLAAEGREAGRIELTLGADPAAAAAALDGHGVLLLAVDPYPKEGRRIERSQYQATLKVEAGGGER